MMDMVSTITHDIQYVNACVRDDAEGFVAAQEARYEQQLSGVAEHIVSITKGCQPVMLCGASSVGKTTTANKLCEAIEAQGITAFVVSLDDFYRGVGLAPLTEDGQYDYESPEAMNIEALHTCMREWIETGRTWLPRYDFRKGAPAEDKTLLSTFGDAVVIFEGINAFSPIVNAGFDGLGVTPYRVFINTRSRFVDGEQVLLSRRDIRLSRRLLRDKRTRASSFANTMSMWPQVMAGEERYIFPYVSTANAVIDTTMAYEPCLLASRLLPHLQELEGTPYADTAARLEAVYQQCAPLSTAFVPKDSLLREFVGVAR